jgi:hypothetical protein
VTENPRWWGVRRVRSGKPATYRCPFCGRQLHAMSDHVLIAPEGDSDRRRHAHTTCVARARAAGTLRTYDDWRAAEGGTGPRRRWLPRLRRRPVD